MCREGRPGSLDFELILVVAQLKLASKVLSLGFLLIS